MTGPTTDSTGESVFDFDPATVCPDCHLVRAKNGKCACAL